MPGSFDFQLHDDFVEAHGDRILWQRATKCSCGNAPDPARARIDCQACHGSGMRYAAPVELVGLVTGVGGREKALMEMGLVAPGDMVLGLAPGQAATLRDYDLVRLTWDAGSPFEGDVLRRGVGPSDRLSYEPARILDVTEVDPSTGAVTTYPASSYSFAGRLLTWAASPAVQPAGGDTYTVAYDAVFEWVVFVSPLQRYEAGASLGQRCLLRKRHIVSSVL